MAEALDDRYGANFYRDLKTRTWDILNSLTHTGMLQLAQRFTKHEIKSSYIAQYLVCGDVRLSSELGGVRDPLWQRGRLSMCVRWNAEEQVATSVT